MRLTRILSISALLALLLAACAKETPAPKEEPDKKLAPPKTEDRVLGLPYVVQLNGDIEIDISKKLGVRVLTTTGRDPEFLGIYLLSVGPSEPVPTVGGAYFRVAFDLVKFQGNGKYRIRAGSPSDLLQQPQQSQSPGQVPELDQSNVLVQFWSNGEFRTTQPQTFNKTLEPCPVDVSKEGLKGELLCPQMTDDNGHVISVLMRWG